MITDAYVQISGASVLTGETSTLQESKQEQVVASDGRLRSAQIDQLSVESASIQSLVMPSNYGALLNDQNNLPRSNVSMGFSAVDLTGVLSVPNNATIIVKNRMLQQLSPSTTSGFSDCAGFFALAAQTAPQTSFSNGEKAISYWNPHNAVQQAGGWRDIEWASELNLFVAVSAFNTAGTGGANPLPVGANNVQYSSDGIRWNNVQWGPQAAPFVPDPAMEADANKNVWHTVKWAPQISKFVAVAKQIPASNDVSHFAYSTNGTEWTLLAYDAVLDGSGATFYTQNTWAGLAWSANLGLFSCVSNNNVSTTSTDGVTWTPPTRIIPTLPTLATTTSATDYNNLVPQFDTLAWACELGLFVAPLYVYSVIGITSPLLLPPGNGVVTSVDGMTWQFSSLVPQLYAPWKAITWSSQLGLFAVVGEQAVSPGESTVMTSADGKTWSGISYAQTQGNPQRYRNITWAPEYGMFLGAGYNNVANKVLYSFDGLTWDVTSNTTLAPYQVRNIVYSRELCSFILCADGLPAPAPPNSSTYFFGSSNIFKLPGPRNVFNACYNRIDEAGSWGMGAPSDVTNAVTPPSTGFFCIPAGNLNGVPLPTPVVGNGLDLGYAPMFFDTNTGDLNIYNFKTGAWVQK